MVLFIVELLIFLFNGSLVSVLKIVEFFVIIGLLLLVGDKIFVLLLLEIFKSLLYSVLKKILDVLFLSLFLSIILLLKIFPLKVLKNILFFLIDEDFVFSGLSK